MRRTFLTFAASLVLAVKLVAQDPSAFDAHLASGKSALRQSKYVDAEKELKAAIVAADTPVHKAEVLELLCDLDLLTGKYADAVPLQEQAVRELETSPDIGAHVHRLAAAYRAAGKAPEAEAALLRVLDLDQKGGEEQKIAADGDALGSLYLSEKRFAEARAMYLLAFNMRVKKLGSEHLDVAGNYVNMGVVEERDKKFVAARVDYDQALQISERLLGAEDYRITGILDRIGALLRVQKRYALAVPFYQRSLSIREKTLGPSHSEVAPALDNLALTYFADAKFVDAEPLFLRSLQVWEATSGPLSPQVALALDNLGALYSAEQRQTEAEAMYKRALWLREKSEIETLSNLALLYGSGKDLKRAEAFFLRALLIAEKGYGGEHEEAPDLIEEYATFLDAANRPLEAKKLRLHEKEVRAKQKP